VTAGAVVIDDEVAGPIFDEDHEMIGLVTFQGLLKDQQVAISSQAEVAGLFSKIEADEGFRVGEGTESRVPVTGDTHLPDERVVGKDLPGQFGDSRQVERIRYPELLLLFRGRDRQGLSVGEADQP